MNIREASVDDAPYIADIAMQVFGERNVLAIEKDIESPNYIYYLLLNDEGRTVAYISLMVAGLSADIIMIATDKAYRSRGYARVLLDGTVKRLKEKGVEEIFLEVRENNEIARKLYDHFGFQKISIRKKYYDGTIDGIVMKLAI